MTKKKKPKKITEYNMDINGSLPGDMAQVVGLNDPKTVKGVQSEMKAEDSIQEVLRTFQNLLKDPKNIQPVMIGTDAKGQIRIIKLEREKDGSFKMPDMEEWKAPTYWDVIRKKRKVNKIMKYLHPILKRDIGDISRLSLARKDEKTLDKLLAKLKSSEGRKRTAIRDRLSCFYIETDDDSILLSG
jgi:hypothetical protein